MVFHHSPHPHFGPNYDFPHFYLYFLCFLHWVGYLQSSGSLHPFFLAQLALKSLKVLLGFYGVPKVSPYGKGEVP